MCPCEDDEPISNFSKRELIEELNRRGALVDLIGNHAFLALEALRRGQNYEGLLQLERALGYEWDGVLTRLVSMPDNFEFRK